MRTMKGLVLTGLLSAALTASAAAQARGYVGFGAGLSIPTGNFADGVKTGWLGQVVAGITGPNGMLGGRVDGMFIHHSWKGTSDGSTRLLGLNADVVLTPGTSSSKIRPYFLGGVGFFNGKDKIGSVSSDGETKFAFNVGAGLKLNTSGRMSVFLEGRYLSIRTSDSIGIIPIAIGVRWGGV